MPPIPEGQTRPTQGLNYADIESIHLPPSKATKSGAWITDGNALYYHKGSQWGVSVNGGWGWIVKNHETEFLYLSPDTDPLLKSHGHWWTKKQGTLLIYHDGQGLGAEELSQWNQDQKNSNLKTTIRYSSDLKRMAIISSKSLTVFNLDTGDKIQEISLHQNLR